ncbi:MAG: uncharacterized protein QG635_520 [Bacteroidota bacterium]|nr:uncharacterized protein [Bacteroidota bacterium]
MNIHEILQNNKTVAVYGMSKSFGKAANIVPMFLKGQGYNIIPINPTTDEINGIKCYQSLADVTENIDILDVFRPSEQAAAVVREAVERRKAKGDIQVIWLQEGITSEEGSHLAEESGILFVQDKCMLKEYERYF